MHTYVYLTVGELRTSVQTYLITLQIIYDTFMEGGHYTVYIKIQSSESVID